MENIDKQYCIETAIDRSIFTGVTHMEDARFAYDLIVDNDYLSDIIPLVKNEKGEWVLRFKNLMRQFYWLTQEFLKSVIIYRVCMVKGIKKFIEDKESFVFNILPVPDNHFGDDLVVDDFEVGDIVVVSGLHDELVLRFKDLDLAKEFYDFAKRLLYDGEYDTYGIRFSMPYFDCNLYLEQQYSDIGLLSPAIEVWVPSKKYFYGDIVFYSISGTTDTMSCYRLANIETQGNNYVITEVTKDVYNSLKKIDKTTFKYTQDNRYYIKRYYFNGYYDDATKLTYFDYFNGTSLELKHWKLNQSSEYSETATYTGETTAVTESMLTTVIRRRTDMDASGETLPFLYHYESIPSEFQNVASNRLIDIECTEFQYMCGFCNMKALTNGDVSADVVNSIQFYTDWDLGRDRLKCPLTFSFENNENQVILSSVVEAKNHDMVKFVYTLGVLLEYDSSKKRYVPKVNTGVKYTETYSYIIARRETPIVQYINGKEYPSVVELPYIRMSNMSDALNVDGNMDMEKSGNNGLLSTVTIREAQIKSDDFADVKTCKDDSTLGLQDATKEIDATIERGGSASFEKHNALGEVFSLQDLEHYRNDYFKITQQ